MLNLYLTVIADQIILTASSQKYAELYVCCTRRDNPETLYIVLHAVPHDAGARLPMGRHRPPAEFALRQKVPASVQHVKVEVYQSDAPFNRPLARATWQREETPALAQSA